MREVTKEDFYKVIYEKKLDVHPRILKDGSYFEFKNRTLFGRRIGVNGNYWDEKGMYFIED